MKSFSQALLLISGLFLTAAANSHDGATGIVKERMDGMKSMSEKTKRLSDMYKGKLQFDRGAIAETIDAYKTHGEAMRKQFPDTRHSRSGSDTEALPRIWDKPEQFAEQIDQFLQATDAFERAFLSDATDKALRKPFLGTAKGCRSCHKAFRKPKK